MTGLLDQFIEDARGVSIEAAAGQLGLQFKTRGQEHAQPCPNCGGTDTFAFNTVKNAWNCRHGGAGGRDAIGMAAHCLDLDISRRDGFLEACAAVLVAPIPDEGERESDAERAARQARIAERKRQNEAEAAKREADQADFREREREKARGIYAHAARLSSPTGRTVRDYLARRGVDLSAGVAIARWVRAAGALTYWHGQDAAGRPADIHSGPAMVLPFLGSDMTVIGCHQTWIDLDRPPKYRPVLSDPDTGELLPTKKMRGSKKGGLIPLSGHPDARRWVGAEGIENTLAFAGWEEFRPDTFYFAAGDLGNLSGPADPASRFAHPTLTKVDKAGRTRPVMVAGPVPLLTGEADSIWVSDRVDELVLLADGDSERVMTAAAMARAKARHARLGRKIFVVWPKAGFDLSELARTMDAD
nr:P4 alpha zinc-binding domain-containing protein [Mesorhizobium sp.]